MISRLKPLLSDLGMGSKAKYLAAALAIGATMLPQEPADVSLPDQSAAQAPAGTTTIAPSQPASAPAVLPMQQIADGIAQISQGIESLSGIPLQSVLVSALVMWAGVSDRRKPAKSNHPSEA